MGRVVFDSYVVFVYFFYERGVEKIRDMFKEVENGKLEFYNVILVMGDEEFKIVEDKVRIEWF